MTGNITSSSKGKTDRNTPMDYVEDDVDELSDSDISKAYARVLMKHIIRRLASLNCQSFLTQLESLGRVFIVMTWRVICRK